MPKNVLTDAEVKLTGYLSEKKYPESFRFIRYYDEEDDREFTFLTNAKHLSALDVANLYKKRWLVELFFKWLKQHLKIKRFWGTTKNAVRIQISVAIITYCLVAIVHHDMQLKRSTYEVLQILSISLTDKTHLRDLFDKTIFNDVKELDLGSYIVLKAIHAKEADAAIENMKKCTDPIYGDGFRHLLAIYKKGGWHDAIQEIGK